MDDSNKTVITRMPPSPTGNLHVGNLRTLVFNYLFAQKYGGKTVLRIEDTDKERSKKEYEENIFETLDWLGITYDGPYHQSKRNDVYQKYIQEMLDSGHAYVSEESHTEEARKKAQEEGRELRDTVIRFRNPGKVVTFVDEVLGEISRDTTDLGDFVIAKDMDTPLYHLAVVVDDFTMGITHILRGADHVANTPRQILIQEAIGAPRPIYAHLPLIVGNDGKKLSKRHGAVTGLAYRDMDVPADAFLNFLAFVGWNPGNEEEFFTREALVQAFDLTGIQKGSAVFDEKKLRHISRLHIRAMDNDTFAKKIEEQVPEIGACAPEARALILADAQERVEFFSDITKDTYAFVWNTPDYDEPDAIVWKKSDTETTLAHLRALRGVLEEYSGSVSVENMRTLLMPYAEEHGKGDVLWPLRYTLSGRDKSPDPFTLLAMLGIGESVRRIDAAIQALGEE